MLNFMGLGAFFIFNFVKNYFDGWWENLKKKALGLAIKG